MPTGTNPLPYRAGGQEESIVSVILESLLQAMGTGLSSEEDSYMYAEALADARSIAYLWELNERFALQSDPATATDFLDRWVAIKKIPLTPGETTASKRSKLALKVSMTGLKPDPQTTRDFLIAILGDVFVEVHHYTQVETIASIPGGLAIPGGTTLVDGPFSSHTCHLGIEVQQPSAMSGKEFKATANSIYPWLLPWMPAWTTFNWFKRSQGGALGFFLDEPNLSVLGFSPV